MIEFSHQGDFKNLEKFLKAMKQNNLKKVLSQYGQKGVDALSAATPKDSGATAGSWDYSVEAGNGSISITWTNSVIVNGTPLVILLQYGHGTGTGGYVQGRDFINPAIQPIFDSIADGVWKVVTSS